ncbi:MAG TPA: hypothetical protein DEO70_11755 [Bacteroidales bacterium]|nr:MAG: hypothetical protein A2X11_09740 [Bacteroidetes bacterium GWE2_42_24]OFY26222.1 MAG: hypothetical protein A2X09_05405 [Bacteroidetes bacterium GWF2_43_11]HBZ67502.1 hypothetical protein [Bacteroidales bacterium]
MPFISGLTVGLAIALSFGPAFIYMMQTALRNGIHQAMGIAVGIVVGDFLLVLLAYTSIGHFLSQGSGNQAIGIFGGIILAAMGIINLIRPEGKKFDPNKLPQPKNYHGFFIRGFVINLSNPFNLIFWIGITGAASTRYHTSWQILAFLAGVLTTEIISSYTKCKISADFRQAITPLVLKTINQISGSIFIITGVYLMANSLQLL